MAGEKERKWVSRLAVPSNVAALVRERLGCGCPREVFEHYQVVRSTVDGIPLVRLIMGDRLLVWIVDPSHLDSPGERIRALLEKGVAERDRRTLNRFRLVIAGKIPPTPPETVAPRVHLHFLKSLPWEIPGE